MDKQEEFTEWFDKQATLEKILEKRDKE